MLENKISYLFIKYLPLYYQIKNIYLFILYYFYNKNIDTIFILFNKQKILIIIKLYLFDLPTELVLLYKIYTHIDTIYW